MPCSDLTDIVEKLHNMTDCLLKIIRVTPLTTNRGENKIIAAEEETDILHMLVENCVKTYHIKVQCGIIACHIYSYMEIPACL